MIDVLHCAWCGRPASRAPCESAAARTAHEHALCQVCEAFLLGPSATRQQINLAAREVEAELARRHGLTTLPRRDPDQPPTRRPRGSGAAPAPPGIAPGQGWAYLESQGPERYVTARPRPRAAPAGPAAGDAAGASPPPPLACSWCGRPGRVVNMTARAQGRLVFSSPVLCHICAVLSNRLRWPDRRARVAGELHAHLVEGHPSS